MRVLVTGGSGYLGRQLLADMVKRHPEWECRMLDRNEETVRMCLDMLDGSVDVVMGDVRDEEAVKRAVVGVDTLVHLAAMKHIDLCETNTYEAVMTNVVGTMNLLRYFGGESCMVVSTDKAVNPAGCYGATKFLMERLVLEMAKWREDRRYMVVRSGNIFASSGSVIGKWKMQLKEHGFITVTNPDMTRYFITAEDLSSYMLYVLEKEKNGGVYVPSMKVIRIGDLAEAVMSLYGKQGCRIKRTGLRIGEKMHERLFTENEAVISDMPSGSSESLSNERMSVDEIVRLIKGK